MLLIQKKNTQGRQQKEEIGNPYPQQEDDTQVQQDQKMNSIGL